jgi:2-iminobutanoate/2-iminopropanoate deaminase
MKRSVVSTPHAPAAIGAYSQAVRAGDLLFCSGQIPIDPATGDLVMDDIAAQTKQSMENLGALLEAGGSTWAKVVKVSIFLTSMADFAAVNAVYATYFEGLEPPARACVAVKELPKGVDVEIECIAICEG